MIAMEVRKFKAKNGKTVVLRPMTIGDIRRAKEFADYINRIVSERDFLVLNRKVTPQEERAFIISSLAEEKKGNHYLIAEVNGKIVGLSEVVRMRWAHAHIGKLGISVKKEYRGVGIGTEMLKLMVQIAKKMKLKMLRLSVYTTNKQAVALYKKLGFKVAALLPDQRQRGGKFFDEFIMLKYL